MICSSLHSYHGLSACSMLITRCWSTNINETDRHLLSLNLQLSGQDIEKVIASHHSGMKEATLEGIFCSVSFISMFKEGVKLGENAVSRGNSKSEGETTGALEQQED